jgi:hypothetical protein
MISIKLYKRNYMKNRRQKLKIESYKQRNERIFRQCQEKTNLQIQKIKKLLYIYIYLILNFKLYIHLFFVNYFKFL